jgi:arginyl-tRNA synthetase
MNLRAEIEARIERALRSLGVDDAPAQVVPAARPEFGDYQVNGIMSAAKRLGRKPRELATATVAAAALDDLAERADVAGPGFINVTLRDDYIAARLGADRLELQTSAAPQTIVVDYSSVNLIKEMHVGHLRSTIIGDALCRIFEALGHRVIRQNHVGDWGTQFGMVLAHLEETGASSELLSDLEAFYVAAKQRFDSDVAFAHRARQRVVALQSGDPDTLRLWQRFIEISLSHCDAVYTRLGVSLNREHVRGESAYNEDLPEIVQALERQGLLEDSQGAKCVFLDEFKGRDGSPLPVIVQKSDGGYLYATTDLAGVRHRCGTLRADRVLVVVGAEQSLHLRQVFAVARRAGFARPECRLEHVPFGNMLNKDGRKFSTRAGGTVKLMELLDEAEERAYALVTSKTPELSQQERREIARVVGVGALKYADLSKNRTTNYVFDWDQMLSFDGNTAPYLQYAYTRIRSLFRRAGIDPDGASAAPRVGDPAERRLALQLLRLQEVVEQAAADAMPHYVCTHLYEIAASYMQFYERCPVLNADAAVRDARLALCRRTGDALDAGLALLGIETIERM